jgi:alkanesulfonate monooxygenase SsuD/methylene tetrahydromethanopterin reductase-like flavin-dependent oxidoreductase (luciferase family)
LAALRQHCLDIGRPPEAVLRSHISWVVVGKTEAAVDAKLAARLSRATATEAEREPGMPRQLTSRYSFASIEHLSSTLIAGTPPQMLAYYRTLAEAGMQYFIVNCGQDHEALRLLGEEVVPRLTEPN